jgi:hypothetical protein
MLRYAGLWVLSAAVSGAALAAGGCGPIGQGQPVKFVTNNRPIEFTFPNGWYLNKEKNPFDLQCFSRQENMNTGVFAYSRKEFPNMTLRDVLQQHVDDVKSKRQNFSERESLQTKELTDKKLTTVAYIAEKDGSKNCYRFTLIEFSRKARYLSWRCRS